MLTKSWFYLPFVMLLAFNSYSQTMTPEFSADKTAGCAPLTVSFRDLTTGNPKFWNWDFGNGTLSNVQYPSVTYSTPGTYTVTLVVRNADGTNGITKTNYITVYASPSAGFSADITTGCVPVNVQFTDKSTSNNGNIVSWQWDFGDGTTSTAQNPQKTYSAVGFYSVALTVTSSSGCKSTAVAGRYIRIVSGVTANFDNSKATTCQAPYTINFTNQSAGPGNMSYQWDLGNGTNSSQVNPSTTYAASGNYNVTLTAFSDFGCSASITKTLNLNGTTTAIKAPDTVCQSEHVWFTNNSSVKPIKTIWDFGNGSKSTNVDDSAIFVNPGDYTIKLYNAYSGCIDSAIHKLHVRSSPPVDFTVTNNFSCKPPLTVNFKDNSPSPIVDWKWDFGDGSYGDGSSTTHTYNAPGIYSIRIVFTDNRGCQGSISKPSIVQITPPTASITNVAAGGCVPYTFTPTTNVNAIDGVANWQWDWGDGTSSTGQNATHTYTTTGTFTVKLTITTNTGCSVTTVLADPVRTGTPPAPNFSISNADICASQPAHFNDLTPQPVDFWTWDFGDGTTVNAQNPDHKYKDTGTFVVKLTAFNNRCPMTSAGQTIHIKPAVAKFTYKITCGNFTVPFTDKSETDASYGAVTYSWQFGNPSLGTDNAQNPSFTFPGYGTYPVTLTVTNGSCSDTYVDSVRLVKEIAKFTNPATACKNANVTFTSTNNQLLILTWQWSVDGGPYTAPSGSPSFTTSFATTGQHSIGLTITDINGCTDTQVYPGVITITGPVAKFTEASSGGCRNATIAFNDLSTPAGSIQNWTFEFGDGKTQSFNKAPFTHIYSDTGEFVPKLIVQDNMGCTDTAKLVDTIFISAPKADFTSDLTTVCPTSDVHFRDTSSGNNLTYLWNFGNGATSTQQDPVYSYGGGETTYTVKLVVTQRGGCSDSISRTGYITTIKPKPAFDIQDTTTICPPLETKFVFRGKDYQSFEWDFGDGATSTLMNPSHFYNTYGDFIAKLYLTGYGGCIDSASHMVHVYNPGAVTTLNYGPPLEACNELLVNFSITTPPNLHFAFGFGDGVIDTSMATTYQHLYTSPAFYGPYVHYTDKQGCIADVSGPAIKVIGAEPFFAEDKKKFCDSGTVYFTNYTIGNDPVVTRTWDFGDGTATTSDVDPIHYYQQPGTFSVSQTVTTQAGCTKTIADTIRVFRTPDPIIVGDSIVCVNQNLTLKGTLAVPDTAITWKWDFGNGTSLSTQNVSLNFPGPGNYAAHLQATNKLGCSDTTSKNIFVPPIPDITIAEDPVIPVSMGVTLPVTYSPDVTAWTWTPAKNLSCTDCPNPYANPKQTTTYHVKATDQYGCSLTKDITVTVVCNGLNYFIPNTFSPNGDGVNDVFAPRGVGLARINGMRIFNRWGEMVFEKMNFVANDRTPNGGWDGTYQGKPAPADVYVYIIEFVCENSAIVPVKGNVALVR